MGANRKFKNVGYEIVFNLFMLTIYFTLPIIGAVWMFAFLDYLFNF